MSDATIDRFVLDVERSHDTVALDAKIKRDNARAERIRANEHDPWKKFRESLSLGRGLRTIAGA